jgi:hypothetical protein
MARGLAGDSDESNPTGHKPAAPQSGCSGLGDVQDDVDVHLGTLAAGTGMLASPGATGLHFH